MIAATDPARFLNADQYAQYQQLMQQDAAWHVANPDSSGVNRDMGKGDSRSAASVSPYQAQIDALLKPYLPKNQQQMLDDIANGFLAADAQGNIYNPRAPQGFEKAFDELMPYLVAAATIYAGGAAFASAGAGTTAAATTATEVAASTAAAGEAAAATTAAAAGAGGAAATAAGTLEEIVVTAQAAGGISAGTAAAIGGGAAVAEGAIDLSGASGSTMPTVNAPQSMGEKLFMSGLKKGAINSVLSTAMGGDPVKGFGMGFAGGVIGGGISAGLQSWEASTGALDAIGNTGIKAFNSAIAGAGTAAILGGDPVKGGLGGLAGSIGSSVMGDLLGKSGQFDLGGIKIDLGKTLGSVGGSMAMSALLGGNKRTTASGYYGSTSGQGTRKPTSTTTNTNTAKPTTPDWSAFNFPTINQSNVNLPTAPYYGIGYRSGSVGDIAATGDESYWGDDQEKLKKLLAALQQQG
jgi:hypothetical protein